MPNLADGIKFYTDAGLVASSDGNIALFRCAGQLRGCLTLIGGAAGKRLHHVTLRADGLDDMAAKVAAHGGKIVAAPACHEPEGHDPDGLWVTDPHAMLIHLIDSPPNTAPAEGAKFEINAPGRIVGTRRPAMLPGHSYKSAEPLKLGHILLFSPDVPASVDSLPRRSAWAWPTKRRTSSPFAARGNTAIARCWPSPNHPAGQTVSQRRAQTPD